jgi:hypothetical protein
MAALWIRYEMSYDSFHKDADRMYCVFMPDPFGQHSVSRESRYLMAERLKATFPEVADAATLLPLNYGIKIEEISFKADLLGIDSSFFNMFDVKVIAGSMDFLIDGNKSLAITDKKARQLFGNESPLGKKVRWFRSDYTVCAVVTDLPKRSNYPFDFLHAVQKLDWNMTNGEHTLVKLVKGIDIEAFKKKLYEHKITTGMDWNTFTHLSLVPLTSVRYKDPNVVLDVKLQHIVIFSVAGLLLILCTLFNYLTLFVSRFRIRQQELALRIVCGASNRSLFVLLSVEFVVTMIIALVAGVLLILAIDQPFLEMSKIRLELSAIYLEVLTYTGVIILISLLTFILTLAVFRRRTLNISIRRSNRKLFRKASIVVQLIISIVFAFCTVVILKQMYHLHNTADLGFAFKNRGSIIVHQIVDMSSFNSQIKQIPEIIETVETNDPLLPFYGKSSWAEVDWTDKPENAAPVTIEWMSVSEQFLSYYEIKTVEGELLKDHEKGFMINESAAKAFGWHTAVGKSFGNRAPIIGVIKNICNLSPTIPPRPACYKYGTSSLFGHSTLMFKYAEGTWESCKRKIEEVISKHPHNSYRLSNTEEEYDKFLKSENTLLKILTLVSLVCVIVCVFGFVSMVSLTCEERRKEIAIRKINGATIKDILDIFFKEYLTLLIVGAMIAFPVGYLIMKRWLENYVVQTEMSAWIYVAILLALITAIIVCVGGRVYRTSRENPADSIKG